MTASWWEFIQVGVETSFANGVRLDLVEHIYQIDPSPGDQRDRVDVGKAGNATK